MTIAYFYESDELSIGVDTETKEVYLNVSGPYNGDGISLTLNRRQTDHVVHSLLQAQSYLGW